MAILLIGLVILGGYLYVLSCRGQLSGSELSCSTAQKVLPFVDAIPFVLFAALISGAIIFYLLIPDNASKEFNEATLKFLSENERVIVKRIIERGGEAMQSELTRLEGMSKVKSHRTIQKLKKKGVVRIQQKGKTNIIRLTIDIYGGQQQAGP